jgi:DNA (cytosine-5)-methyltransferase 1
MSEQAPKDQCATEKVKRQSLPLVSFFSGAGGLDLGFIRAGFTPVIGIDQDPAACKTYTRNHPGVRILKRDLSSVPKGYVIDRLAELPEVVKPVGVIGGPPCQAFSEGNRNDKVKDARADLPKNYARFLKELASAYEVDFFLFENVLGLRYRKHSELFTSFKKLFESAGFLIFEGELDAQDFGVPQARRRLFVVGFNEKKYAGLDFKFPEGSANHRKTVRDVIGSLPQPLFYDRGLTAADIPFHPNHWCMRPRSKKFFNGYLREGDRKGRPFRVLRWDRPSWTVAYGNREVHVHPAGGRRLSVYEAMLLQGFPADYEFCGTLSDQIRLVSDAVPPPLARGLAEAIRKVLEDGNQVSQ